MDEGRSNNREVLDRAIDECLQVTIAYDGDPPGDPRVVCPAAIADVGGESWLLAYQIGGYSGSGLGRTNVRTLEIDRLRILGSAPGDWTTVPGDIHATKKFIRGRIEKFSQCPGDAPRELKPVDHRW